MKTTLCWTLEYEGFGRQKADPGFVELRIHYDFTPSQPETGRGYMADPANYDPGSGHEAIYDHAEREWTDAGGGKHWRRLMRGEWLDEWCQRLLAACDEEMLLEGQPGGVEP